ncbi:sensor histidine kinase [Caminibacter pacificus]
MKFDYKRCKLKLNHLFFIVFVLISLFVFIALYNQYRFSKEILIQNFINKELLFTSKVKEKLKNVLDIVQFTFKSTYNDCIKKTEIMQLLYSQGDFNATKVAQLFNKNHKGLGHYEVFVIGRNYKIIDASYKPDLGFDLGKFKVYKYILDQVFKGKRKIDVSYPHVDYSSMNIKKYYLVRSPDGKVLLQLAYVIDIYSMMKKVRDYFLKEIPELKKIDIYFVEKYLIYKIDFNYRSRKKIPLPQIIKRSDSILKNLFPDIDIEKLRDKRIPTNVSYILDQIFNKNDRIIKFSDHKLKIITLIRGIFNNSTDKLILETEFDTSMLNKNIENLRKRFLMIFASLVFLFFLLYRFLILKVSRELNNIIEHMKENTPIPNTYSFIEEISELKKWFNEFRQNLNREIEKNKQLLSQNKRFIVDTIHQIKTPISVITLNIDFIKDRINDSEIRDILEEIEASVAMLTNSYEDLSYISGNGVVRYEAKECIDLGDLVKRRAEFFKTVAKAHDKKIICDIDKGIKYKINNIEFERIVDNNISNAIKYSTQKEIYVSLKKKGEEAVLKFESGGEKIKNPLGVFEKNYREHSHKRGLGIGLNIVKEICNKYGIAYRVYYKDGRNVFEYRFKIDTIGDEKC